MREQWWRSSGGGAVVAEQWLGSSGGRAVVGEQWWESSGSRAVVREQRWGSKSGAEPHAVAIELISSELTEWQALV